MKTQELRAALKIAGNSHWRSDLHSIHIEACGRIVACDGHRALFIEQDEPLGYSITIPKEAVSTVLKGAKFDTDVRVRRATDGTDQHWLEAGNNRVAFEPIRDHFRQAKFQPIGKAVPQPGDVSGEAGHYNADYLADFSTIKRILLPGDLGNYVLHQNGPDKAAVAVITETVWGLVMPWLPDPLFPVNYYLSRFHRIPRVAAA